MPMPSAHFSFLLEAKGASQTQLQLLGTLVKLDAMWNGSPDYDSLITQAELDSVTRLYESGYTTAEVADALYALTVIKGIVLDHLPALSRLADLP